MNLDELQSVQSRERQASSLQHLRASFYEEAGEFIGERREERNAKAAASENPFDDEEIERLSDEIKTAERTVESIYERRVGKVVKLASIAAAGMPYDDDGLTTEEERLFESLVERIERNRDCVLSVLDGESPALDCSPAEGEREGALAGAGTGQDPPTGTGTEPPTDADPGPGSGGDVDRGGDARPAEGTGPVGPSGTAEPSAAPGAPDPGADVGAAAGEGPRSGTAVDDERPPPAEPVGGDASGRSDRDAPPGRESEPEAEALDIGSAMGGATDDAGGRGTDAPAPAPGPDLDPEPTAAAGVEEAPAVAEEAGPGAEGSAGGVPGADPDGEEPGPIERTTVRVTADVGNIYGIDGRSYDLSAEDVVTLPSQNAENLVSKRAAERLD